MFPRPRTRSRAGKGLQAQNTHSSSGNASRRARRPRRGGQSLILALPALPRAARAADRRGWRTPALIDPISQMIARLIVDHPHARPPPFIAAVIDENMGGRPPRTPSSTSPARARPRQPPPRPQFRPICPSHSGFDRRHRVERRSDEEIFGPDPSGESGQGDFDRRLRRGQCHALTASPPRCSAAARSFTTASGPAPRRSRQLNNPTNGAPSRPFRRHLPFRHHRPSAY